MSRPAAGSTDSSDPAAHPLVPPLSDADGVPLRRPPAHSAGNRAARLPDLLPTHLVAPPAAPQTTPTPTPLLVARPRPEPSLPIVILGLAAAVLLGIVVYLVLGAAP